MKKQEEVEKDEWPVLLYRDPPFPFVPPFDFVKFPGTAKQPSKSRAFAPKMGKPNLLP